jgi:hypothetical protein
MPNDLNIPCDYVVSGSSSAIGIIVLASVGVVANAAVGIWIVQSRNSRIMKMSQWKFMAAFAFGSAALCGTQFLLIGRNVSPYCLLRPWLTHLTFTFAFSALFAKVYRVW